MAVKFRNYSAAIARVISQGAAAGLTPHEVLIGNAAGGIGQVSSLGTAGQLLTSQGAGADPSWQNAAGGGGDSWGSSLLLPTGLGYTVKGETFARTACQTGYRLTSSTARSTAFGCQQGVSIGHVTFVVAGSAETGGSHGWYAVLDNTFTVRAVSADQTSNFLSPADTPITLGMLAPWTPSYSGAAYLTICCTASTNLPTIIGMAFNGTDTGATQLAPKLGFLTTLVASPPAVGTTLATSNETPFLYGCYGT